MTIFPQEAFSLLAKSPDESLELWKVNETKKNKGFFVIGRLFDEMNLEAYETFPAYEESAADLVWGALCEQRLTREDLGRVRPLGPHRH